MLKNGFLRLLQNDKCPVMRLVYVRKKMYITVYIYTCPIYKETSPESILTISGLTLKIFQS